MNLCVCVHQKEVDDEIRKCKCSAESVTTVGVKRIERAPTELDQNNSEKTTASPTTQKRHRLSLLQSARRAHAVREANDKPAVAGLFDTLIHTAAPEQLLSMFERSNTIMKEVLPRMLTTV